MITTYKIGNEHENIPIVGDDLENVIRTANAKLDGEKVQRMERVKKLVVDSNAFINNTNVYEMADEIYTVPEVFEEIKDPNSVKHLTLMPKEIKLMSPDNASVQQVIKTSKKIGDYYSLSSTDIKLLALVYMLECERIGKEEMEKKISKIAETVSEIEYCYGSTPENREEEDTNSLGEENAQPSGDKEEHFVDENMLLDKEMEDYCDEEDAQSLGEGKVISSDDAHMLNTTQHLKGDESESEWTYPRGVKANNKKKHLTKNDTFKSTDFDRWITPNNIHKLNLGRHTEPSLFHKDIARNIAYNNQIETNYDNPYIHDDNSIFLNPNSDIACCSSDYAIQNVALIMSLNVLSSNGLLIKKARVYVLRCHACREITKNFTRLFCPKCGNNSLLKTTASIDRTGKMTIYLKRNFQYRTRGTIYPIPLPRSGKKHNNIILRDGQRELIMARRKKNVYKPADLSDSGQIIESVKMPPKVVVGYGRINPNEVSRRNRRR